MSQRWTYAKCTRALQIREMLRESRLCRDRVWGSTRLHVPCHVLCPGDLTPPSCRYRRLSNATLTTSQGTSYPCDAAINAAIPPVPVQATTKAAH